MRTDNNAESRASRHQYVRCLHFFCKAIVMKLHVRELASEAANSGRNKPQWHGIVGLKL
jgi:hypothetical protein